MTEVKTFHEEIGKYERYSDKYKSLNEQINKYTQEKDLYIKSIHYDRLSDVIIANVLFTDIPNELFLL